MAIDPENGGGKIAYTAKQLFEKIDTKLERVLEEIAKKADRSDVEGVKTAMEGVRTALAIHLASPHATPGAFENFRAKVVGILIGVGLVSGGAGVGIARLLH